MDSRFKGACPIKRPVRSPARVEAEALYRLVQKGRETVEGVHKLIEVPPGLEDQMKDARFVNPVERKKLLATIKFRRQVLKEFDEFVAKDKSR